MKKVAIAFSLVLLVLSGVSCTSTGTSGNGGFYSTEPERPIDRAVTLQRGFGSIQRSGMR